jgi:hypothetical protein
MRMAVDGSVDLPVIVAILFEDVPQEHQLSLHAVFITQSSSPMLNSRQYCLFIGWVMMGLGIQVETGACGFGVHFVSQRAIRSPVNKVHEEEVAFTFGFHGELNGLMDVV